MAVQFGQGEVAGWTQNAIQFLVSHKFLIASEDYFESKAYDKKMLSDENYINISDNTIFVPTAMGRATVSSGISPQDAVELLVSLEQARQRYIQRSGFHAIYLATPPSFQALTIDWTLYARLMQRLQSEQAVSII